MANEPERKIIMTNFTSTTTNAAAATPTTKFFRFNHINSTIEGSEFNFKKAGDPTTAQFADLMLFKEMAPTYKLAPIASKKKVEKKESYEGLTMSLMEEYLNLVFDGDLADVACAKFAEMKEKKEKKELSFGTIKSWFLEMFPKFNVGKARLEIRAKKLAKAKAPYKVIKVSVGASHTTNK